MNDMMALLEAQEAGEMTRKDEAMELHRQIVYNYRMAASHLVDAAKGLKTMRDTKAYRELGMDTFEEYTETMAGIKARQAYTYIGALERLGAAVMEEHAGIGITKLALLAEITPDEREDFAAENDLGGMTVKEIEALVAEKTRMGEQITMFEAEKAKDDEVIEGQADIIRELQEQVAALQKSGTVTIAEPSEEQLAQIRKEAEEKIREDADKKAAAAIRDAVKEEREKTKKKLEKLEQDAASAKKAAEDAAAALEAEKARAAEERAAVAERAKRLEAELKVAGDGDVTAVNVHFEALQRELNAILQLIAKIRESDEEKAKKVALAVMKYVDGVNARLDEEAR